VYAARALQTLEVRDVVKNRDGAPVRGSREPRGLDLEGPPHRRGQLQPASDGLAGDQNLREHVQEFRIARQLEHRQPLGNLPAYPHDAREGLVAEGDA
jgi:hypothetical protein